MKTFYIAKSDVTGAYYLVIDGKKYDITDYFEKHDAKIRRKTIEECMENIIPTLDENGVDKDVVEECIRYFKAIAEQMKGAE